MQSSKGEIVCRVCGDKASGKHYGVPSCDGCRGFFKRSIRRNLDYVCKENNRCVVDVTRRNQCQACRFSKCLKVNMKKDAVQHERAPRVSLSTRHLTVNKLGYNLSSQPALYPSNNTPLSLSNFPTYASLAHPSDLLSNAYDPFERTFPDFSIRHSISHGGIPHLHPLFNSGASLGGFNLNPFKMSLFPSPLHYSTPHSEYFSSNIFYPPPPSSAQISLESAMSQKAGPVAKYSSATKETNHGKHYSPNASVSAIVKEDEVTSSEEAYKDEAVNNSMNATITTEISNQILNTRIKDPSLSEGRTNELILEHSELNKLEREDNPNDAWSTFVERKDEPAVRVVVASIRWLRGVNSFMQLDSHDQDVLLIGSWRELFIITAAQMRITLEEGVIANNTNCNEGVNRVRQLIRKVIDNGLDKTEYELLKTAVLYRSDLTEWSVKRLVEKVQERTLEALQEYSRRRGPARFGRLMLLLPGLYTLAYTDAVDQLILPDAAPMQLRGILSHLLRWMEEHL